MSIEKSIREKEKTRWEQDRQKFNLNYPAEDVVRFLKKNVAHPENCTILDFACGSGRNLIPMADMHFHKIIAMDYNQGCLDLAKEKMVGKNASIKYIKNDRLSIPLEDHSVDVIIAWGALFYFTRDERKQMLTEIYRVLKKGGMIAADFRGFHDGLYGLGKKMEDQLYLLDERAGHLANFVYWFTDDADLTELFKANNFEIMDIENHTHVYNKMKDTTEHYIVWAKTS